MKINQMFITFEIQKMYKMIILLCINGSSINQLSRFIYANKIPSIFIDYVK